MTEKDEILSELDELAGVPEKQPNDLSTQDLSERWGITDATVHSRMRKLVEQGLYETHLVYDPETKRICRIYRKVVLDTKESEN